MASLEQKLQSFSVNLFKIDAVKFGEYKTKIGLMTPVYCDLRVIISYPDVMNSLADLIVEQMKSYPKFDVICGVPYTALPIATAVSIKTGIPMVMRRKEPKDYGTKQMIEGKFNKGDSCLIIEDVVTSGSSILETVKDLETAGLRCSDVIVVLNREQGGADILKENNITMHALLNLTHLMKILKNAQCINELTVKKVEDYLSTTRVDAKQVEQKGKYDRLKMRFEERAAFTTNNVAKNLLNIMVTKKTNLCVAADLTSATDILNLAESIGPHICALKTHIDIVEDFNDNFVKCLKDISERHKFVLFEDRKYSDIGETVRLQYTSGVFQVSSWAKLVTAHSLIGKGVLDALSQAQGEKGVFLLAETSASDNLISPKYVSDTVKLAKKYPDLVVGIVCQNPLFAETPGLLQLTPGVRIDETKDSLSQTYNSPELVVLERGADIAVVGRGITQSTDPESAAIKYRTVLWEAYSERVKSS